jgi:hypothetical protein
MKMTPVYLGTLLVAVAFGASGCNRDVAATPVPSPAAALPVQTSGKETTVLDDVPAGVLQAAAASRPDLSITGAEHEVRDGRQYYDVAGLLPDGSELELDMMLDDGTWKVMEVQRDIGIDELPSSVRGVLSASLGDWQPDRIIESDQGDGLVIYEFLATDGNDTVKHEVKWTESGAELLTEEWAH